jgi:hypothetical protein
MFKAAVLTGVLLFLLWPDAGYPDMPSVAETVDLHDGAFTGHPAGIVVMNVPCVYGDRYHYEINSEGVLGVRGPINCGSSSKLNSTGGEEICYLNPQLNCLSRTGFSMGSGVPYAINESGVKVGNKVVPWMDAQKAIALMPSIKTRAKAKCDTVLFWQSKEKAQNKPTSIPAKMDAEEGCKATLVQICASSGGKLENGKDISNLCRP